MTNNEVEHAHRLIEAAFQKLPLLPERRSRLPGIVRVLAMFAGRANKKTPPPFLPTSVRRATKELQNIANLATALAKAIETAHQPTIVALADRGVFRDGLIPGLRFIATAARTADVTELASPTAVKGRPPALAADAIARIVASSYEALTGKKPTVTTVPDTNKPKGQFFELMKDVFTAIGLSASPESAVRTMCSPQRKRRKLP